MKVRITPAVFDEIGPAIEDSLGRVGTPDQQKTDPVYVKINTAWDAATSIKRGVVVDLDADDLVELKSRAEYQLECVIPDNLPCHDPCDRGYWLGRQRAYRALVKQIKVLQKA